MNLEKPGPLLQAGDGKDRADTHGWGRVRSPTDLRPPPATTSYHTKVTSISFRTERFLGLSAIIRAGRAHLQGSHFLVCHTKRAEAPREGPGWRLGKGIMRAEGPVLKGNKAGPWVSYRRGEICTRLGTPYATEEGGRISQVAIFLALGYFFRRASRRSHANRSPSPRRVPKGQPGKLGV